MKDAVEVMGAILPEDFVGRDAVHVATFSAFSTEKLMPGQDVALAKIGRSNEDSQVSSVPFAPMSFVGIVDPFLKGAVPAGERFLVFIYPRTTVGLKHIWGHPAFPDEAAVAAGKEASEAWLRNWCDTNNVPGYEQMVGRAMECSERGDEYVLFGTDAHGDIPSEFWDHLEVVTGKKFENRPEWVGCAC